MNDTAPGWSIDLLPSIWKLSGQETAITYVVQTDKYAAMRSSPNILEGEYNSLGGEYRQDLGKRWQEMSV